jgi:hypothetical protein
LQPAFTQAAVNLADLNLDAARRSARRLAELEPDDPEVRVLLRQVDAAAP